MRGFLKFATIALILLGTASTLAVLRHETAPQGVVAGADAPPITAGGRERANQQTPTS